MSLLDEFKHSLHICMAWQQAANVFLPCESFKCCYPSISRNESHSQTGHGVQSSEHLHSSNPAFDLCESVCHFTGIERYKLCATVTWKDSIGKLKKNKSKGTPAWHRASRTSSVSVGIVRTSLNGGGKPGLHLDITLAGKHYFLTLMSVLIIIITLSLYQ